MRVPFEWESKRVLCICLTLTSSKVVCPKMRSTEKMIDELHISASWPSFHAGACQGAAPSGYIMMAPRAQHTIPTTPFAVLTKSKRSRVVRLAHGSFLPRCLTPGCRTTFISPSDPHSERTARNRRRDTSRRTPGPSFAHQLATELVGSIPSWPTHAQTAS
ncbi:hypothetical protein EDB92DRAFT_724100 [Lactarius akahatsu]|uniref:Uncharacterized protein n=1 Tax=Lactarius akahatsu TaxID=416441 RepID=A0AAD4LFV5_9AGAM|nr:hypothetical protein EDB92DRAFT_724100 [Lactarius akahatsu]